MGDLVWVRTVHPHTSGDRLACEQALYRFFLDI